MVPLSLVANAIWIRRNHWDQMQVHVAKEAPIEACGLVAGHDQTSRKVFPVKNELHSPSKFRMNGQEQLQIFQSMDAAGLDLLAIYHSHPRGPAHPSPVDIEEAYYPKAVHLIWSPQASTWRCRGFLIERHQVLEIPVYLQEDDAELDP